MRELTLLAYCRINELYRHTVTNMNAATSADPITVSAIQHRLSAIVEEMGDAMLRTLCLQILE